MERESVSGLMEKHMKETGLLIREMDMEVGLLNANKNTRVIGLITKLMGSELFKTKKQEPIRDNFFSL